MTTSPAELRALLARATPREWHIGSRDHMVGSSAIHLIAYDPAWGVLANSRPMPGIIATGNPNCIVDSEDNIALIVAAVNSLPDLLDTLDQSAARIAALEGALEKIDRDVSRAVGGDWLAVLRDIRATARALLAQPKDTPA